MSDFTLLILCHRQNQVLIACNDGRGLEHSSSIHFPRSGGRNGPFSPKHSLVTEVGTLCTAQCMLPLGDASVGVQLGPPQSFDLQLRADLLLFLWKPHGNLCRHPELDPVSWYLFTTPLGIAQGCWSCTTDTSVPALLGACRY